MEWNTNTNTKASKAKRNFKMVVAINKNVDAGLTGCVRMKGVLSVCVCDNM